MQSIFESSLDLDGFYDAWITEGRSGVPLPALDGVVWESVPDTGDSGWSDRLLRIELTQRQLDLVTTTSGCVVDASALSTIGAMVGCGLVGDDAVRPLDECLASRAATVDAPVTCPSGSVVQTLTEGGDLDPGQAALPAWVGILGPNAILPEGAPPVTDCDDADADASPGAGTGVDPSGIDVDCDGWCLTPDTD